jgi:hypothetical protein
MFAGAASVDAGRPWRLLASGSGALASPASFQSDLTTLGSDARRALATSALPAVWARIERSLSRSRGPTGGRCDAFRSRSEPVGMTRTNSVGPAVSSALAHALKP